MAFKITKEQTKKLGDLAGSIQHKRDEIDSALAGANDKMTAFLADELQPLVDGYNELIEETRTTIEEIASEMRGEYDDKSESWQESNRGQEVSSFIDEYENALLDEIAVPDFEPLEFDVEDAVDIISGLPGEVE